MQPWNTFARSIVRLAGLKRESANIRLTAIAARQTRMYFGGVEILRRAAAAAAHPHIVVVSDWYNFDFIIGAV